MIAGWLELQAGADTRIKSKSVANKCLVTQDFGGIHLICWATFQNEMDFN